MNSERIRELIKQATNPDFDSDDGPMNELNIEKFAELIVRECMFAIVIQTDRLPQERKHYNEVLKRHFGVK